MNDKGVRIYDLARRLAVPSRELLNFLKKKGIEIKSHMNTIDGPTADMLLNEFGKKRPESQKSVRPRRSPKRPMGRTFAPPKQQKPSERQRPVVGVSSAFQRHPSQKPTTGEQTEKPAPRRKQGRKFQARDQEQGREPNKGEKRRYGAAKKSQRGTQGRPPSKRQQKRTEQDDSGLKKEGKPSRRRYENAAEEYRRRPQKKTAAAKKDETPRARAPKPRRAKPTGDEQKKDTSKRRAPQKRAAPQQVAPQQVAPKQVAPPPPPVEEKPKRVRIPEVIALKDLAAQMDVPPAKIITHLMTKGILANVNQMLEPDAAKSIAESFEFEVEDAQIDELHLDQDEVVDESKLRHRPPVVTIMGHVDHGKTTLLDAIRESKIADSEFGGITQHIGAYVVNVNNEKVVFLDTPGHEAFTAMRARGAQVTDEVILVVAADDGIMPQTIEAIDHAKAAGVPIIVAINKMDLPGANPDRVMQELTKYGLTPEDWGGDTICVQVSAKQKTNLDALLEMIVLQAEMLELQANPDRPAKGVVVEAMLDKGRGPVATVLVQQGTLKVGDAFVVGTHYGRVRAMLDARGRRVKKAGPATPVEVLGLTGVPVAGDGFAVVDNDRTARQIASTRQEQQKTEFLKTGKITLEELHQHIKEGEVQELRIVIKADVHGSVEALGDALARLSTEQVRLQVIHGGVGAINETDVMLAAASNGIVLGFNVRPVAKAREMAEKEQIEIRLYTIIYQAIEDIKKAMEGLLAPTYKEVLQGQALVQATFSVPKIGTVAGCRVTDGKITRNSIVKLYRDHKEVYKGNIDSLRRVKDDVREVANGYECGIKLENYNDIKIDDIIEAYSLEKVAMTLEGVAKKT